jgi:hypothetical protein
MYVEAYKEAHVKEAIRGLRVFYQSKGAKLVPLKEMVDAITVNRKAKASLGSAFGLVLPPSPPLPPHPFFPRPPKQGGWQDLTGRDSGQGRRGRDSE